SCNLVCTILYASTQVDVPIRLFHEPAHMLTLQTTLRISLFTHPAPPKTYTLSLHDALPITSAGSARRHTIRDGPSHSSSPRVRRSEEHTSELQSPCNLVCRLLLEKKKRHVLVMGDNHTCFCCRLL